MNPREFLKQQEAEQGEAIKDLVQVSNSLVESFVSKSNSVALKMLFYIAKQQHKESGEITKFTLSIDDFATYCKLDHRTIRDNIKAMQKTSLTFVKYNVKGKKELETFIVLIPYAEYNYTAKTIEIDMYKKILDLIVEVEERFTTLDVKNIMELESKYSIRMTMILEHIFGFKGSPENWDIKQQKTFTLDDLNDMFGTSYKNFTDVERKILIPTKAEMDDKSDISFTFTINKGYSSRIKRGRPKALDCTIKLTQNKVRQRRLF
jgi:plasmid replication initiation protein